MQSIEEFLAQIEVEDDVDNIRAMIKEFRKQYGPPYSESNPHPRYTGRTMLMPDGTTDPGNL